ncbi:MAG: methyltransferase family protein, partial [bacterium]
FMLVYQGVQLLYRKGKLDPKRSDSGLWGIERTTRLVTTGVYRYIRHPFYCSLLLLSWGILLKRVTWIGISLGVTTTIFLIITARKEEIENIQYFGEAYQEYMKHTKMFVPFIF